MKKLAAGDFKRSIENEKLISLNFSYLSKIIGDWWAKTNKNETIHLLKLELISILLNNVKIEDKYYFNKIGDKGIAGICLTKVFNIDCPKLALVVHESLSDLFQLHDIKYPYEEHKALYMKPTGEHYRDWGNGYGEITPHSDDLYEDLDTDFLSLTVCRDTTKTPTIFYLYKDILKNFTDFELIRLFDVKVKFISGKNVQILKTKERNIVEYFPQHGLKFSLDFRIDMHAGERMTPINPHDKFLIDKMRTNIASCRYGESIPETGTFLIIANYKILHSRATINIDRQLASNIASYSDFSNTPRLLFRSKGPRKEYIKINSILET